VGRYGEEFWLDLIKEVDNKPQFEFLKPADSKFDYFNRLSVVASEGLKRSEKLTSSRMAIVSKAFFYHLRRQNEKRELTHKEGAAKACTLFGALYAFVGPDGCFADIKDEDLPLLQHPSAIKNILTKLQPRMPPLGGESEEPEFDESVLVPEDQFLAQHPVIFSPLT